MNICHSQIDARNGIKLVGSLNNEADGKPGAYWFRVQQPRSITEPNVIVDSIEPSYNKDKLPKMVEIVFLDLEICYVPKFPRHGTKFTIINSKLKEINHDDLAQFPNLESLWLHSNELKIIETNLFASNLKLKEIDLSRNKIWFIGQDTFKNLNELREVKLEKNVCIDKNLDKTSIDEVYTKCSSTERLERVL